MLFEEIIEEFENLTNRIKGYRYSGRFAEELDDEYHCLQADEEALSQLSRYFVESRAITVNDLTPEYGESESQLVVNLCFDDGRCHCNDEYRFLSPYLIISNLGNKFVVEVYGPKFYYVDYVDEDFGIDVEPENIDFEMMERFEIDASKDFLKDVSNSYFYRITADFDTKSTDELAKEILSCMSIYGIDRYSARNKLITRYGEKRHARLTWVMYNCISIGIEDVLENLQKLIGEEFVEDDIICAFEDFEEFGESSVYIGDSNNAGYDKIAYIDAVGSTQFLFELDEDNCIEAIQIA